MYIGFNLLLTNIALHHCQLVPYLMVELRLTLTCRLSLTNDYRYVKNINVVESNVYLFTDSRLTAAALMYAMYCLKATFCIYRFIHELFNSHHHL